MRGWRGAALVIAVQAGVLAAPRVAHACTPCIPERYAELADVRDQQPGNTGVMLFRVEDVDVDIAVTIDGVAAELELSSNAVTGPWGETLPVAQVVPTPPVGSTVELSSMGVICFGGVEGEPQTFVAGPPDETVPEPIADPWWDLLTLDVAYPQCSDPAAVIWLRGELVAEPETESVRIVEVSLRLNGQTLFIRRMLARDPAEGVVVVLERNELEGIDARELCLSTTVVDVADHRGTASPWVCGPCHARFVPDASETVDEPDWTDADLVPDGYCGAPSSADTTGSSGGADEGTTTASTSTTTADPSSGTTTDNGSSGEASGSGAADGVLDRGCGCTSDSAPPPWLILLTLGFRRRSTGTR